MSQKTFNTAGPCDPERHYLLPPEARLGAALPLIENGNYFVVHAPRQSGKTTSFQTLARRITAEGRFVAIWASCENAQAGGEDAATAVALVVQAISDEGRRLPQELRPPAPAELGPVEKLSLLEAFLTRWAETCPRPIVLFLDEIDSLLGNSLISVLRQLRKGYSRIPRLFPQSVALIGLRDVRDYRLEVSSALRRRDFSFLNFTMESLALTNFTAEETASLCRQHQQGTGQIFEGQALQRLFALTQGQPWLVNALARSLVEVEAAKSESPIQEADVVQAADRLLLEHPAHLALLTKSLTEPRLRRVIEVVLEGGFFATEVTPADLQYAVDQGLLRWQDGHLAPANPIYLEIISRVLGASNTIPPWTGIGKTNASSTGVVGSAS